MTEALFFLGLAGIGLLVSVLLDGEDARRDARRRNRQ